MDAYTTAQAAPESDSALLGRYADSGDMDAFAALVKRHTQTVYGVCVRRLWNNRDLAQDATQMVFALLATQAGELRKRTEVGSWLYKAAAFTAMRIRAKEGRREAMMSEYADNVNVAGSGDQSGLLERARDMLDVAVAKLSEKYRQVLVMHYFQGLSYDQIAAGTGSPVGTVRTHLDRAREKLRAELARLNLALTGPVLLSLLQNEGGLQVPVGLIDRCLNAVRTGGGTGHTPDHDAILKDMHSAESWGATAKVVLGACIAVVATVAAIIVVPGPVAETGVSAPGEQRIANPVVQAESDIIFRDDFRDGFGQWDVMEKAAGNRQFAAA
ncbi:MAG: hypothetical protein C0404_11395, partial [Verrucomicrobia bacterium]|nr:hypothetical protein [Verrucomicrobiota bacterium]